MEDIHERSPLGHRMLHLSKDSGVSDFYATPWEPLTYKRNGLAASLTDNQGAKIVDKLLAYIAHFGDFSG